MLQRDLVPCLVSAYWVAECNVSMSYLWCDIFVANCLVRGFGHGHSDVAGQTAPDPEPVLRYFAS